ncbi:hypothetical protein ACS0TY_033911 [Phlomoides rotata]
MRVALPESEKEALLPKLRAKPVRTALTGAPILQEQGIYVRTVQGADFDRSLVSMHYVHYMPPLLGKVFCFVVLFSIPFRARAVRAGHKLVAAIEQLDIDDTGKVALDSGLSTGGFTDYLLHYGASFVYGVDVGYGQVTGMEMHQMYKRGRKVSSSFSPVFFDRAKIKVAKLSPLDLLSFTIITLILSSSSSTEAANPPPFKNIYAFGDSYTDTGNTRSNNGNPASWFVFVSYPPYGRTFFHHPTNRYSDGRLVIDYVAESLSLQFLPPYLNQTAGSPNGVNFAVSGSTAIDHSFFVNNTILWAVIPQSLGTELEWFENVLKEKGCIDSTSTPRECEGVFNDSLIWLGEIGANDYLYSFFSSAVPHETVQQLVLNSITDFLQRCLSLAKYLVPPTDRDKNGCTGSHNQRSFTQNAILKTKLDSFRKNFPQSIIVYADYYNAFKELWI